MTTKTKQARRVKRASSRIQQEALARARRQGEFDALLKVFFALGTMAGAALNCPCPSTKEGARCRLVRGHLGECEPTVWKKPC
jgi:hypothetical protein